MDHILSSAGGGGLIKKRVYTDFHMRTTSSANFVGLILAWRPPELTPAQQVEVDMEYRLPCVWAHIGDKAVSLFETQLVCNIFRSDKDLSHQLVIRWRQFRH